MTRTFPPRIEITRSDDGFTLIELIVVVALIVLITVFAVPSISSYFQVSLNTTAREIASTVKESYNSAVITGKVYRLSYDMKKQQYWVEVGPMTALLDTKESKEEEDRKKRFSTKILGDAEPQSAFSLAKLVTRKKVDLPRGVTFEDVVTQQSPDPLVEGMAYTHYFPHGITERTIIHLQDTSKHHVSLVISPLIGKTDVYDRYVTAEEIFKQK